jgi:hypothetical protein
MALYQYLEIPPGTPRDPSLRFDPRALRISLEVQINDRNINLADRIDLLDGSRVYRVNQTNAPKLPTDSQGYFLLNTEDKNLAKLRFVTNDLSFGRPLIHDWVNIRS